MTEQTDAPNPYRSPTAALDAPSTDAPSTIFRWRIIPAFLTILYGVPSLLGGVVEFVMSAWVFTAGLADTRWRDPPVGWLLCDATLCLVAGVWFVIASRAWWTSRYKRAVVFTVLACAVFLASVFIKVNVIFVP